jgi:hypothetical protein
MSFGGSGYDPWTAGSLVWRDSGEAAPRESTHSFGDYGAGVAPPRGPTRRSLGRGECGPSPRLGLFPQAPARMMRR